jgi:hypothetical protein
MLMIRTLTGRGDSLASAGVVTVGGLAAHDERASSANNGKSRRRGSTAAISLRPMIDDFPRNRQMARLDRGNG